MRIYVIFIKDKHGFYFKSGKKTLADKTHTYSEIYTW